MAAAQKVRIVYTHPQDPSKTLETAGWYFEEQNDEGATTVTIRRVDGMLIDFPKSLIVEKHVLPG